MAEAPRRDPKRVRTKRKATVRRARQHARQRVAFITTPRFREYHGEVLDAFICQHLYWLVENFEIVCTGGTHQRVLNTVSRLMKNFKQGDLENIATALGKKAKGRLSQNDLDRWKDTVSRGIGIPRKPDVLGMIEVAKELVEERLHAIIHLMHWTDMNAKPDTAVLWREANNYNVPFIADTVTAEAHFKAWNTRLSRGEPAFSERPRPLDSPLEKLGQDGRVLALVAHDTKKREICNFAVRNAQTIHAKYQRILTTGTTGEWVEDALKAAGHSDLAKRVIRCHSGPKGGDMQIAFALLNGRCHCVVFFQDPATAHAHDADIRVLAQALLHPEVEVPFSTNEGGAAIL